MRSIRGTGLALIGALALGGMLSGTAAASEYNLKSLPEIGRCVKMPAKSEYRGRRCALSEPGGGRYAWFSGAGEKNKFTSTFSVVNIKSAGDTIMCFAGSGEGQYTGAKTLKMTKLVLLECKQSAKTGTESLCQNEAGSTNGEVTFLELQGDLGFISHPKKLKVGWDLKPASGSNLASFECGGANTTLGKSTGTGVKRELQGSVIGRVLPVNKMVGENVITWTLSKSGAQSPQQFEGGVPDTLTTLVEPKPAEKTPEATVLVGESKINNQEALEVLGKCVGTGC